MSKRLTSKERLDKVLNQIATEEEIIKKANEKVRKLNAERKLLEKKIKDEEFAELKDLLNEYGVSSVGEFEKFLSSYSAPKQSESAETEKVRF